MAARQVARRARAATLGVGALALAGVAFFGAGLLDSASAAQDDRAIFCSDFVPNEKATWASGKTLAKWASQNPGERDRWSAYADAICAGDDPAAPAVNTLHGQALVAAGRIALLDPPADTTTSDTTTTNTTTTTETTETETTTEPPPADFGLYFSTSSDRASEASLDGANLSGLVYVFTREDSETTGPVRFFVDEEPDATAYHTENNAPFDLQGGSAAVANPLETANLANGAHRIVAVDAAGKRAAATFTVENDAPEPPPPPPTEGQVLYRLNFEHPDSDGVDSQQWGHQCQNIDGEPIADRGTQTKVSSPAAQGSFAGRFDLPSTTQDRSACELLHGRRYDHGTIDYYAMAVRFPAPWGPPSSHHWGMGILQANYTAIKSAPVALHVHGDHVALVTESGACGTNSAGVLECQYRTGNGAADGPLGHHYAIPRERFAADVWHELVMRVHWHSDPSQGVVEVFHRRKGETAWVKTADLRGLATVQWRAGNDPTTDKGTTDKVGAQRGGDDYPVTMYHDAWCRATSFTAAESCLG